MIAFLKKEFMSQFRTGKMLILGLVFMAFGIMNPAVAKLTPWLLETMGESLASSGLIVTQVEVSAMDSWVQFFKNIPMALMVFVLMQGGIFTDEYRSGTLILSLTKGLGKSWILLAKTVTLVTLWSVGYWLCAGITYAYNAWYWDNSVAQNLWFSVVSWWVFGLWVLGLMVLFSVVANTLGGVALLTGGSVLAVYLLGFLPGMAQWMPTALMKGTAWIYGLEGFADYGKTLVVAVAVSIGCVLAAMPLLHKKQL